jgi:hypothetical protein
MALINQGGKLLLQNGALASGAACCCNKCSGPCDSENPCPEGCACVDGECVTSPCSGPCGCQEQDFACSVIFFDTEEEANQFCQDPAKIFRNCDIYDPAVNPLPDQGERWGVDYCECTAPSACPEGCACVDGECVQGTGACCVCTDGWYYQFIGDRSWDTKEEADAWNLVLEGIAATAVNSLEANGYECIFSNPPSQPFLDESLDPPKWYNPGQGGHGGTCCGVIDYEGTPASDGDNDTIYPCIQDDVTRDCVEGVSQAECEDCEAHTFHAGQTCGDNPCNPLP